MLRDRAVLLLLAVSCLCTLFAGDATARPSREAVPLERARLGRDQSPWLLSTTSRQALLHRESAGPDTFDLYGGPSNRLRDPDGIPGTGDEYVEGKFQDVTRTQPRGLSDSPNDWTGVDPTDVPQLWRVDTFNAANLNGHGSDNRAAWIGLPAGIPETADWSDAPGYGNNWENSLEFVSGPIANPSAGQTVTLDFVVNVDTELGYDFLFVEYQRSGLWETVLMLDGTNKDPVSGDFPAPGLRYADLGADPIVYTGNDYGDGNRIRLRLRFASDGAYSDEDGLFTGRGGAQVDDIVVTTLQGTFTEDFEGAGPFLWTEPKQPLAGDFSNVFLRATDIDPCASNPTPQLNFIDYGQEVRNGPGANGDTSTGGSISPSWSYGVAGGFVFNYTGGLDNVDPGVQGEVRSPVFAWDLPGTDDDGPDVVGAVLSFDVFRHQPLVNGIFFNWGVRFRVDGEWGGFRKRGSSYYGNQAEYVRFVQDVTDLAPQGVEAVQIQLRGFDWASIFGFPGSDATPGPWFDNVRFSKYRVGGVALSTREIDAANDAFPVSGEIDASTQAARDRLDVRFDMARDISSGELLVPGDSVIVDATPIIPGTQLADLRMVWALRVNPLFETAIRSQPNRPQDENVAVSALPDGRPLWTGEVVAGAARTAGGAVVADRYFVDLPDADFLYPGDVLHYFLRATDSDGRVTTLPSDTAGFGQWDADGRSDYDRTWTVRALPSLEDAAGTQPSILVWNDFGRGDGEEELLGAFDQLGLREGFDFDTFTTQGARSGVSNGLGSAGVVNALGDRRGHGANAAQVEGYATIVYFAGNRSTSLLSDGSDDGANDKSADVQLLTAWKGLAGNRGSVYFGDDLVSATIADSPTIGATYVADVLRVDLIGPDVGTLVGGQTGIGIRDVGLGLATGDDLLVLGGCPTQNTFDAILPRPGAIASHAFLSASGVPVVGAAAGVLYQRGTVGNTKSDLTFPFGLATVVDPIGRAAVGANGRARLLEDALTAVGATFTPGVAVDAPARREPSLAVQPNPFNPRTTVVFTLPRTGMDARVEVFDLRGQRVATLFDGTAGSAQLRLTWDGRDGRGARVASGIYLVRARTEDFVGSRKVALVE